MKLCYQVATPDVAIASSVTAYQGPLDYSLAALSKLGYDGVEFMTLDPEKLDWEEVKRLTQENHLDVALVCTGEIFGQLGLSFTDPDAKVREEAIRRVYTIIDFASFLGTNINIGRIRGQYRDNVSQETTWKWAVEAFRAISRYAAPRHVDIALETVTLMQTNFINTVEEGIKMIEDVGEDNFKLMMDVFHLNIEEKDMLKTIREYQNYNMHVHLADNNRRYPGQCGMDFDQVISAFHDSGYDGAFCTEIFQIPDQHAAAEGAIRHLAPIFERIYGRKPKGFMEK